MIKTELAISKNNILINYYKITKSGSQYRVDNACGELIDYFEDLEDAVRYCLEHDQ